MRVRSAVAEAQGLRNVQHYYLGLVLLGNADGMSEDRPHVLSQICGVEDALESRNGHAINPNARDD
jgi:hypothetical protein